jgi:DNA polymerase-3 subunit gamma/tau
MPVLGLHCGSIIESRHIDVIEMDAASHTGIDDVREIIESARYKPVLARYKVNLYTAKIATLGERVEDVFVVDGPMLSNARSQIALESDLLDALRI